MNIYVYLPDRDEMQEIDRRTIKGGESREYF